jgi:RNA polymerase sigma factor (sigma-70 family)
MTTKRNAQKQPTDQPTGVPQNATDITCPPVPTRPKQLHSRKSPPPYLVTQADDEKLVISAQRGSEMAFNTLIYRYRDDAYRLAYKILYKPNGRIDAALSADDVLQEACIRAWKYIKACEGTRFQAWFRGIVKNECARLFKDLAEDFKNIDLYTDVETIVDVGHWMVSDAPPLPIEEYPMDAVALMCEYNKTDKEFDAYLEAIGELPPKQRAVMNLHLNGYKNKQIAKKVGMTPNAVGFNLHSAKASLQKLIKNKLENEHKNKVAKT